MQSLIKTCALSLIVTGLTACGGSGGGDKPEPTAPSSSPASSAPASSAALSSAASSVPEGSEKALEATAYNNYSVAEIENCGVNISAADKTFAVFADYDGAAQNQSLSSLNISGWNHTTNGSTTEWTNLKNAGSTYNFNSNAAVNDSCNGVDTMNIVLVKKIADWDRQHSNGFERNILAHGYKFGDIQNLIVDIKVNSAKTSIPSVESLKATYANYVEANVIEALDEGKVNVDITLHDGGDLYAKVIFQLDQASLGDKWVRVTIPVDKLYFYQEVNYNRTTKTANDFENVVIQRAVIVGETKKGAVLRGDINPWSSSVPETFKEMDLSFKKIELQLK